MPPVGAGLFSERMDAAESVSAPYPLSSPHARGRLDVSDGHSLYWEARGQPERQARGHSFTVGRGRARAPAGPMCLTPPRTGWSCSTSGDAAAARPTLHGAWTR